MTVFDDPDSIGSELPNVDPGTDCEFRECKKLEAGEEIVTDIDAVLEVFDR